MTAKFTRVRQALAARLASIEDLNTYAKAPGTVNTPAAIVNPDDGQFYTYLTSQTSSDLQLLVLVIVQLGTRSSAEDEIDNYIDEEEPQSIFAAVQADQTLGGVVDSAAVSGAQNHGVITYNGVEYLGCEFVVEVLL